MNHLGGVRHWVFDMDGTLTLAAHDFPAIKRVLGIPQEADILHHLAALPTEQAAAKHAWLLAHERELAVASRPAPRARRLVPSNWCAACANAAAGSASSRATPTSWRC